MILRWLKRILLGVFLIILTLMASISALVATDGGSRWVIDRTVQLLPDTIGTLTLGEINGNLLTGLDVAFFEFQQVRDQQVHQAYRAEQLSFRWQPLALLYSAVSVQSLQAENIIINLPPVGAEPEDEPFIWPSFALPLRIELGDVQLRAIDIRRDEKSLYFLQSITGSLSLGTFNFRVTDLALKTQTYGVTLNGRTGLRFPYASNLSVQWYFQSESQSQPQSQPQAASGVSVNPPLDDQTPASVAADNRQPLHFSGAGQLRGDIKKLLLEHKLLTPFVIQTAGSLLPNLGREENQPKQPPYADLVNTWDEQTLLARWFPANQIPPTTSAELRVTGWYDAYHALLEGEIARENIGKLLLEADVRGSLRQVDITQLILQQVELNNQSLAEKAQLKIQGEVMWLPALNWQLLIEAKDLNPAYYFPAWPGDIDGAVVSQGSYKLAEGETDKQLSFSLQDITLSGQLRGLHLTGAGDIAYAKRRWQSEQLKLSLGANQISVAGSYSDQISVQWQIEAPLLTQLDPQLNGSLSTQGSVQGTLAKPSAQMVAQGQDLQYQNYALEQLSLKLDRNDAGSYTLSLEATDMRLGTQHLEKVILAGTGTLAQHDLRGTINTTDYGKLEFALDSRYRDARWRGKFSDLQLRFKNLAPWWLVNSDWISVSAQEAVIGEQCLTTRVDNASSATTVSEKATVSTTSPTTATTATTNAENIAQADAPIQPSTTATPLLCVTGKWNQQAGADLVASIRAVPLRQARALLKRDVTLGGVIDGDFSLHKPPPNAGSPGAMTAQLAVQTRAGELRYQYAGEEPNVYRWHSARLVADLKNNQLDSSLKVDWAEYGNVNANATLDLASQDIKGELKVGFSDLSPFETVIPFAENISGELTADLAIRGKLQKPDITGQVNLTGGSAQMPGLGIELRDINLTLASRAGGNLELMSSLKSGPGSMTINGELNNLGAPDWGLDAQLDGENFQIIQQQQLKANITPTINLQANAQRIRLTGAVKIPYARADIKALPATATRVSPDVVVVDSENGVEDAVAGIPLYANITIELGEDVHFRGFGLDSELIGKINIVQSPPRARLTTGYVSVKNGKYKAYGQELEIERGRLLFQGPYENPGLDIRAVRKTPEYPNGVGLEIGGTLQQPTSNVIAAENLSESESMAILLTGKPLNEASAGEAFALYSIISGSGMNSGPGIKESITQALHVDELSIQPDDEEGFEQSSLLVGKQLSPRLFVRYIVGLFDQAFSIGITYQMTERLRLEAESGEAQSIDVIYKVER